MRFRLHYRGPLKSNGKPKHKQKIRSHFHHQLNDFWSQLPLYEQATKLLDPEYQYNILKKRTDRLYSSVINEKMSLIAQLDITLLRPEPPGSVISLGGDIDNRIKTLLDALTIPREEQIVHEDDTHDEDCIIHCLLEDDHLVTGLNITVDRLLGSDDPKEVLVVIYVNVSNTKTTLENLSFAI